METTSDATDFAFVEALLDTARDLAQRLAEVLDQERAALIHRDMEQLRSVLQEKDQLVTLLGRVEHSHDNFGGVADSPLADVCAQPHFTVAQHQRLSAAQQELRRQISACRDQNHVNGRLVQRARQSVTEVLQIITGSSPAEMYTASGAADAGGEGRTIAKA